MAASHELRAGAAATRAPYAWFLSGVGCWFGAWGMQMVLFAWLVVGELGESAERLGSAQLCFVVPSLLFVLLGGATADRVDRRRLLMQLHLASALVMALLGAAAAYAVLSFPLVLIYALSMGTLSAFAMPARDSLLNEVAGANLMRAVVGATLTQFAAQGLGSLTGGVAGWIGSAPALFIQAGVMLLGVGASARLPAGSALARRSASRAIHEIGEGLREVLGSPQMRSVLLLSVAVGLFFMGPYLVVFPLLVRDYYQGDVQDLSLLMVTFPIGSIAAGLILLRLGRIRRKGRALVRAQALAALSLLVIALGVPFWVAFAASVAWGMCGGVFMNASRAVFQELPPATHRARALSVSTLGFMGAGAIGAPVAGLLAGWLGPIGALATCGVAMLLFVACAWLFSEIRSVE